MSHQPLVNMWKHRGSGARPAPAGIEAVDGRRHRVMDGRRGWASSRPSRSAARGRPGRRAESRCGPRRSASGCVRRRRGSIAARPSPPVVLGRLVGSNAPGCRRRPRSPGTVGAGLAGGDPDLERDAQAGPPRTSPPRRHGDRVDGGRRGRPPPACDDCGIAHPRRPQVDAVRRWCAARGRRRRSRPRGGRRGGSRRGSRWRRRCPRPRRARRGVARNVRICGCVVVYAVLAGSLAIAVVTLSTAT